MDVQVLMPLKAIVARLLKLAKALLLIETQLGGIDREVISGAPANALPPKEGHCPPFAKATFCSAAHPWKADAPIDDTVAGIEIPINPVP